MNKVSSGLRAATALLCLSLGLAMGGCSNKPPGCADSEVAVTAKQLLTGDPRNRDKGYAADDPDGLIAGFFDGLRVELVSVVDNGYDAQTHKQSCAGTLRVKAGDGWGFERQVSYATQRLVDDRKAFQLEMSEGQLLALAVQGRADEVYRQRRWAGEWSGRYACEGVGGATEGPAAPFEMPVTMVVQGATAKLERTTRGGGVETLEGGIYDTGWRLSGQGMNTPDDRWRTDFEGRIQGREAVASGELRGSAGELLRRCELKLTQAAPAKP